MGILISLATAGYSQKQPVAPMHHEKHAAPGLHGHAQRHLIAVTFNRGVRLDSAGLLGWRMETKAHVGQSPAMIGGSLADQQDAWRPIR